MKNKRPQSTRKPIVTDNELSEQPDEGANSEEQNLVTPPNLNTSRATDEELIE